MTTSQIDISINETEEVTLHRKKAYRSPNMPAYVRIGIDNNKDNVLDLLAKCSSNAVSVYSSLCKNRDANSNISTLGPTISDSDKVTRSVALKQLDKVGLVKRLKISKPLISPNNVKLVYPKRSFIINPNYLIPRNNNDFEEVLFYWKQVI